MQSKIEDEIFRRLLAILLEIKDEKKKTFLRVREEVHYFGIILFCHCRKLTSADIFQNVLSEAIKCHLSIPWISQTLYVHLFASFLFYFLYLFLSLQIV